MPIFFFLAVDTSHKGWFLVFRVPNSKILAFNTLDANALSALSHNVSFTYQISIKHFSSFLFELARSL